MTQRDYQTHLLEVRKAWRIIAAYQQRVIYLIDEIEDAFPELVQVGWWPSFYKRPPAAAKRLSARWTWDGLPYYCFETCFTLVGRGLHDHVDEGDWFVVARILGDTGFTTVKDPRASTFNGPDPTDMPDTSRVDSVLRLYAYRIEDIPQSQQTPPSIWNEDKNRETEKGERKTLTGAYRTLWERPLAELFEDGGTQAL